MIMGRSKSINNTMYAGNKYILEFGDTKLIVRCREGKLLEVQKAINELVENNRSDLIDHRNMANETALSTAMYARRELMIHLLVKHGASPSIILAMGQNVLHLAASMTDDTGRRTLEYFLDAMQKFQPQSAQATLTKKNMSNFDVSEILQLSYENLVKNNAGLQSIRNNINRVEEILNCAASPSINLAMGQNVLNLAASMTDDTGRWTLEYLLDAMQKFQPQSAQATLTKKNMSNFDVSEILQFSNENLVKNNDGLQSIRNNINRVEEILNSVSDGS